MIDRSALLKDLQGELPKIEKDILAYSETREELTAHLQEEYGKAREAGRTAEHFVAWREAQITQAAVAWVLSCVFVRFLEDNGLLTEPVLAGPVESEQGEKRLDHAKQQMVAYFNENPTHEEREYLFSLFEQLEKYPAIAELLDHRHNPLWQIPVSADGAKQLIDFFQKIEAESGEVVHDFTDADWDTRFLGDLYQDISKAVQKKYALRQTPVFVESFILDYTLENAIDTFGLPGLRLIDPTCGSGHFLLTTFDRVFEQWIKREPATNTRELAQRALDAVYGVDLNPYAVAICRFRLLIAAMRSSGTLHIKNAPNFHFHLACGDSLLHGSRFDRSSGGIQGELIKEDGPIEHVLEVEDKEKLDKILGQQYHAVVGNPPYISISDKAVKAAVKQRYSTCYGKFTLAVPFIERFFDLCISEESVGESGFMGMINANSFMKREFGKPLIEKYLRNKDMTHIIDSSGADIPGHPTPTFILFARNRKPKKATVRSVLGISGDVSKGKGTNVDGVWRSIVNLVERPGEEDNFVSVIDHEREVFFSHPWVIGGGGAAELSALLENDRSFQLNTIVSSIGITSVMGEDDVYLLGSGGNDTRHGIEKVRGMVVGDAVRNWEVKSEPAVWLYGEDFELLDLRSLPSTYKYFWPYREGLSRRKQFGTPMLEKGLTWYEYQELYQGKLKEPLSISFAFVATHNHFSLDRGGKTFKQTAPVIKMKNGTSLDDHLGVIGFLNSSAVCFWMKQNCFDKGGSGTWQRRYEFDSTKLKSLPIPRCDSRGELTNKIAFLAGKLDFLASEQSALDLFTTVDGCVGSDSFLLNLESCERKQKDIRHKMVSLQEELDWLAYEAYGLVDDGFSLQCNDRPSIKTGERAFEVLLARSLLDSDGDESWFDSHHIKKCTELNSQWSDEYRENVERRIEEIKNNKLIRLIENPEYKRRWLPLGWEKQEKVALQNWLLSFLEKQCFDVSQPELTTCATLADSISRDALAKEIAQRYTGNDLLEAQSLVEKLVANENIPQVAASRLKPAAMKKYRAWQDTWEMQRQEDAIDVEFGVEYPLSEADANDSDKSAAYELAKQKAKRKKAECVGDIPLPPKYAKSDFQVAGFWPLRGKLDVPKERFFSLPGCEKDGDATLVIGWAGMNHLQRAQAIASWYLDRKEGEGWEADKLTPMLVGLDELIPWLKQWHNDIDPEFGERMGDYYEGFLQEELRQLNISRDELQKWEAPALTRTRRARAR